MRPLMPPVQTPDNLFHDGNPLTGELGTIVDAEHLNNEQAAIRDTQSELIAILTAAAMEPESTAGQLLAALNKLYAPLNDTLGALSTLVGGANKLPYFTASNAAALTALSSIGRDIIGKATVADVLTYLGLKEAAKREVGTGPGQIPDMSAFTSGPGWVRFPDGTTIQQGSAGFATGVNNQYVTLPRAFSSANFRVATVWNDVGVSQGGTAAQAAADIGLGTGSKTTTRFGLWQGGSGGFNVDWIAIGVS